MATATLPLPALAKPRNGTHVSASQQDEPTAQLVSVSPAMASEWLRTRHGNRPLSQQRVRRIAAAIKAGLWMVNGGTLVTCTDNRLLDGQHRCAAIEASGTTVQTLLALGVDVRSFPTIDQGRKRSAGDIIRIAGNAHAQTTASALRWTWRYENTMMCSAMIPLNDFELLDYLSTHPGIISSVSWGLSIKSLIPPGVGCMLHSRMTVADPVLAKSFFVDMSKGIELRADDAVYMVRERYIQQPRALHHTAVVERAAAICRAWNCRRGGRGMPAGKFVGGSGQFPAIE